MRHIMLYILLLGEITGGNGKSRLHSHFRNKLSRGGRAELTAKAVCEIKRKAFARNCVNFSL